MTNRRFVVLATAAIILACAIVCTKNEPQTLTKQRGCSHYGEYVRDERTLGICSDPIAAQPGISTI